MHVLTLDRPILEARNTNELLRFEFSGGGIGGLTLAVALGGCDDVHIDVYEQAPQLAEIGAGIAVLPRAWDILKKLGLDGDLNEVASRAPSDRPDLIFQFRKSDQSEGYTFTEVNAKGRGGIRDFHRADFQKSLLKKLPSTCTTHLSHRLTSYSESESSVKLVFENGVTADCHVLVGADGIKSAVRHQLFKDRHLERNIDTIWSGTCAYRGLVESDVLAARMPDHRTLTTPTMYCGKNKHLVVFPVSKGQLVNVVAFFSEPSKEGTIFEGPWTAKASKDELIAKYNGWEEEVQTLLQSIESPSCWAIHALNPLETYVSKRVAILGDAAHAMTPHQGSGAGQAIEDAYILFHLIRNRSRHTGCAVGIPRILEIYNKIRQPLGNHVQSASRQQGLYYELTGEEFEIISEMDNRTVSPSKLEEVAHLIVRNWEWAWTTSAENDVERVLEML